MLPVSAWPPGPPGASLSPFGKPREIWVKPHGFVIPKGAWVVRTTANSVVMFSPRHDPWDGVTRTPGTELLPGQPLPPPHPPGAAPALPTAYLMKAQVWRGGPPPSPAPAVSPSATAPRRSATDPTATAATASSPRWNEPTVWPCPPRRKRFQKHDTVLEEWRAWQRQIGRTPPPIRPTPGRRPPNWFGWRFVCAPSATLVQPFSAGTVLADGQNVVIAGGGCATITQAFSV